MPAEVFHRPQVNNVSGHDLSSLTGKALKIAEVQGLISSGKKIEAIKVFRETFGTGLKEAKDAVDAMERGDGIDISGMRVQAAGGGWNTGGSQPNNKSLKIFGVAVGSFIVFVTIVPFLVILLSIGGAFFFAFTQENTNPNIGSSSIEYSESTIAVELAKFGGDGTGAGKFKDNRRVAVDSKGRVYSGNYEGGKIQVFDSGGKFLNQFLTRGVSNLKDLIADRAGKVYLVHQDGVSVFDGKTGAQAGKIAVNRIEGIALTVDQKLVLAGHKGFKIYGSDLKLEREFNDAAEKANSPGGFENLAIDGNGNILAIDARTGDICKFSADGKFLNRFATGIKTPDDIAISNSGKVFLSDVSKIYVFDENLKEITSFPATQAFGMDFNIEDELFVASRPFVVKYKINLENQYSER